MQATVRILFIYGLMFLSFFYGIATAYLKIFPYSLLRDARIAFMAWSQVLDDRDADSAAFVLPLLERFEPEALPYPTIPARFASSTDDDELILISGGPYELMQQCPRFGCMAWLTNRAGKVAHTWEIDPEELWDDQSAHDGLTDPLSFFPIGMQLLDTGELIISFQVQNAYPYAAGIAKVDRDGNILWKSMDYSHHWPTIDDQGRIYTPALRVLDSPQRIGETPNELKCILGKIYEDVVRVLSPDGQPVREYSMIAALAASDYAGLLYGTVDQCDPTHLNSVEPVPQRLADRIDGVVPGDLLISLRSPNVVAIIDKASGKVKHAVAGRTIAQHSPHFLPDGRVLLLDNLGGAESQGGSRVVRLDLVSHELEVVLPAPGESGLPPVFTETAGHIDISRDGSRALVSLTRQGTVLEIDVADGTVLWEYKNDHDISRFLSEKRIEAKTTVARFATHGAYYVGRPSFLD
jgi:hypothetical protein